MTPREHFTAAGLLTKATRPRHEWECGRLIVEWQMSGDRTWAELTERGHLTTSYIAVQRVENTEGLAFVRVTIGPLKVCLAWI